MEKLGLRLREKLQFTSAIKKKKVNFTLRHAELILSLFTVE